MATLAPNSSRKRRRRRVAPPADAVPSAAPTVSLSTVAASTSFALPESPAAAISGMPEPQSTAPAANRPYGAGFAAPAPLERRDGTAPLFPAVNGGPSLRTGAAEREHHMAALMEAKKHYAGEDRARAAEKAVRAATDAARRAGRRAGGAGRLAVQEREFPVVVRAWHSGGLLKSALTPLKGCVWHISRAPLARKRHLTLGTAEVSYCSAE